MKRLFDISYYLSISVFCFVAASTEATVYKWTDQDGNVQFSQSPRDADSVDQTYDLKFRADKPNSQKDTDPKTSSDESASKKSLSDEEKAAKKKQQEASANKADMDAYKKVNCNKSQEHLGKISKGGRFYELDKNGERAYWDDSMLKTKVSEAQESVEKWCDG